MSPSRAANAFLAAGLSAAAAVAWVVPSGGALWLAALLGMNVAMIAALVYGVRRHRPRRPAAWWTLAVAATPYLIANAIWMPAQAGAWMLPYPSIADGLYLTGYLGMSVGLGLLIRARGGVPDRGRLLDAAILTGGIGVLSWVFLLDPRLHDATLPTAAGVVSLAYPAVDLLLLGTVVRMLFEPGRPPWACTLLASAIATQFLSDSTYIATLAQGTFSVRSVAFPGWIVSYALLGAAALHPSMRRLTDPPGEVDPPAPRWRVPVVAVVALVPSAILVVTLEAGSDVRDLALISVALFLLAEARVWQLIKGLRRTQDRLARAEAQYRLLVEQIPAVTYVDVPDPEHPSGFRTIYASPQFGSLFGYEPDRFVGDPELWTTVVHPEDRVRELAATVRHLETGEPFSVEFRVITRDGRVVWVRNEAALFRNEAGAPVFSHGVIYDITAAKTAEEAVRRSEARFRALLANAPDAVLVFDADGVVVLANHRAERLFGYPVEELVGRRAEDLIPEQLRASHETYRERYLAAPVTRPMGHGRDLLAARKDGSVFPAEVSLSTVPSEEVAGGPLIVCFVSDITARKRAEEEIATLNAELEQRVHQRTDELAEARAFLQNVIDASPAVIFRTRVPEHSITYVSPNVEEVFGYRPDEIVDVPGFWEKRLHPDDGADRPADEGDEDMLAPSRSVRRLRRKDGTYRWFYIVLRPEMDEGGELTGFTGAALDITERHLAVEGLAKAKMEAENANRAKSEFLSRASHELRTPLNAILGFGQLLQSSSLPVDDAASVEEILSAGRHLLEVVNEVLDISRIDSGRLTLSIEPVSIEEVVDEAMGLISPLARARGVELRTETEGGPRFLMADRQRLGQVLLNLLSNAVKYNRERGAVTVSCEGSQETVTLRVADTGLGIRPEHLDRLFSPFERLGAGSTQQRGIGLGLALSKMLVEAMGGTIGVTTEVGAGSTFTVELATVGSPPNVPDGPDPGAAGSAATVRTVLYIEDNVPNLRLMARILARRPSVRLISTMQAHLGIDLARQHAPDMILLDLHLPDMRGEDVLRQLTSDPATAGIPVVVISADHGLARALVAAGARDCLTKPIDVDRTLRVIDAALERTAVETGASG